jgi:hypothetical protein
MFTVGVGLGDAPMSVGVGVGEAPGAKLKIGVGLGVTPGASDAVEIGLLPMVAPPLPQPTKTVAAAKMPKATYKLRFKCDDLFR